jgi:phosphatidylserine decarboxylase
MLLAAGRHAGALDTIRGPSTTSRQIVSKAFIVAQYLFPKQALTSFAGWVASGRRGRVTTALVRWFIEQYNVDMGEAQEPDPARYASFNDFFTRALKPGLRPIAATDLVCPVDGAISHFGRIERDQIFQAKRHRYSTRALVGGDAELAAVYEDGHFATIYLSPRDYHRIHMPCDGRLTRMIHVPGDLFSVNPTTATYVPGLFARNERVVCVFESAQGPFVLVLVGATIVGSMATVWHGTVNPPRVKKPREWRYDDQRIELRKGEEMGRFLLGSTVVLLFPAASPDGNLRFNPAWAPAGGVRLGEAMAERSRQV